MLLHFNDVVCTFRVYMNLKVGMKLFNHVSL